MKKWKDVSVLAILVTLALPKPAMAVDYHYDSPGNVLMNQFPNGGFEPGLPSSAEARAIYDRAGTGASVLTTDRVLGQLVYLAPYTGTGFVITPAPFPNAGMLTLYGIDGVGVDSQVNQQIILSGRLTLAGDQEWRINSESGSIRQWTDKSTVAKPRGLDLGTYMLTLNPVNTANVFNLDTPISGAGGIIMMGAGTAFLTGANVYSGGTFLNGGTLSVSQDGNLGAPSGALNFNGGALQVTGTAFTGTARAITFGPNGGSLDIADTGNTFTVGQTLNGSGGLTKLGAGTLTLTAQNTYTGGTTIRSGTLALTGGGSVSASNRLQNDGIFDISGTTTGASGQSLSGGGTVNLGAQTLTLTAARDTFNGAIQGTGGLTLSGGTETLTGTSGFTGPTTIQAGKLVINGSAANSATTVLSGGTLGGGGTVGATAIRSGGTVAPGNSIGTLHINGDFAQEAGSTFQVEVDPNSNASDLIAVTGTATLASGAALNVTKNPAGIYRPGALYTVLSTTGGIRGTYALTGETTGVSAFLGIQSSYDANNAYLKVVQTRDLSSVAETPNQVAVAEGSSSLPSANALFGAVLNSQTEGAARSAFDQLSGEAQASAKGVLLASSLLASDTTIDRLRDVFCSTGHVSSSDAGGSRSASAGCRPNPERPAAWAQAFGDWGHVNGRSGTARINHSTGGFLIGIDMPIAQEWRAGVFAGYSRTDFHANERSSSSNSDNYHFGVYGGRQWGNLALRLGGSYTWHDINTDRSVDFANFSNRLKANYNAGTTQVFTELGYQIQMGRVHVEPFVNLTYANLHTNSFKESGGAAALSSNSSTMENTFFTLGLRSSTKLGLGSMEATVHGMLGWRHTFGDITPTSKVAFAGGDAFTVNGSPIAQNAAVIELGLDIDIARYTTVGIAYGGQFGNGTVDQSVFGTLAYRF